MNKTAIYIRVSTRDKQDISKQRDFLIDYCKRNNLEIYKIYEDIGISGSKANRPALNSLIGDIKNYNVVLVYKIDRMFRSFRNMWELLDKFKVNNVDFISATQTIDTTKPEGRLFFNLLSSFAEFEREITVQRINDGLDVARERGKILGRRKGSKDKKSRKKIGYYLRYANK
jgi:site-specific DNA recombinase